MGSPTAPAYRSPGSVLQGTPGQQINLPGYGNMKINIPGQEGMPGGSDALNYATNMMNSGLPEALKAEMTRRFQGAIGGNIRTGKESLDRQFARMGDVSIGAQQNAYGNLQDNANNATNDFYGNLLSQDFSARQTGFGDYNQLMGTAQNASNAENTYGMEKYKIDQENSFNIGKLIGDVAGAAGTVGGGAASKTCFCYAELFGKSSKEFLRAQAWGMKNADEVIKKGYMKLSSILIPVMRRSQIIKNLFRNFGTHVLKGMYLYNKPPYPPFVKGGVSFLIMYGICYLLGRYSNLNEKEEEILKSVFGPSSTLRIGIHA